MHTQRGKREEDREMETQKQEYRDMGKCRETEGEETVMVKDISDDPYQKMGSFPRSIAQATWAPQHSMGQSLRG